MNEVIFRLGILVSLFSSLIAPAGLGKGKQPPTNLPAANAPLVTTDRFGYQMDDTVSVDWVDATVGGTKLAFTHIDDGFNGPIDIGFPFKFYENSFTQLYVSTNGLITFDAGSTSPVNRSIPWVSLPNDFIAPMWDDLYLGGDVAERGVYVKLIGASGSRQLVIEWYRVVRFGEVDESLELTFEAILSEDGKIDLVYSKLDGTVTKCTVGIEDRDGEDGLQYAYYSAGLSVGKEIRFDRPGAQRRVKVSPISSSNFAVNRLASFQLVVKNTGDLGDDTFNLQVAPGAPSWLPKLLRTDGQALQDSSSDGILDTGPLQAGKTLTLSLQLTDQNLIESGSYTQAVITATSVSQSSVWMTATAQAAVPGAFVQVYFDASGVQLRQVWDENVVNQSLGVYTGQALAVGNISSDNYLVAWERRDNQQAFTEVVYQVVSRLGGSVQNPLILTNSGELLVPPVSSSNAQNPVVARVTNGQVGVVWRQSLNKSDGGWNSGVRLAVLNSSGVLISDRFNLIDDTTYYSGTLNTHEYASPYLAAGVDSQNRSRFFACWLDKFRLSGTPGRTLTCGVFTFTGTQLTKETQFDLDSVSGSSLSLNEPFLIPLSGNRVLIGYNRLSGGGSEIVYAVRDINGVEVKSPTVVTGASGDKARALQFFNNNVLLLWHTNDGQLGYIVLDGTNYNPPTGDPAPKTLPNVNNRSVASLSATLDQTGKAQITWVDGEDNNYLYYMVLDSNGGLVTPGMQFIFPILGTSNYGQGIASYLGVHQNFLPLLGKLAH